MKHIEAGLIVTGIIAAVGAGFLIAYLFLAIPFGGTIALAIIVAVVIIFVVASFIDWFTERSKP